MVHWLRLILQALPCGLSSVEPFSHIQFFVTPWTVARHVHHHLPDLAQTHVHWVSDVIQPSHPLSSSSLLLQPSVFPSISVFSNTGVSVTASVLPMNTQDSSPFGETGWISLQSKGLSRVFSTTTVQKHQFFSTQLSL